MKKIRLSYLVFAALTVAALALSACGPAATTAAPVPTQPPQPTTPPPTQAPPPTVTAVPPTPVPPTEVPLGSAEKPIIMALAPSATTQELIASGDAIAKQISDITGYTIKTTVPTSYAALVEAMGSGNAQIGWLPTVPYIVAHQKGYADVGLVVLRSGADHYGFELIANKDAGFTSFYDATAGKDTADAATALAQFAGKKPCYTDPLSSSGYLVPAGFLANAKIKTLAGAWVQGHSTVVKSIYLSPKGEICNFGATFIDARSGIAKDFPDVNDKVQIIWVSDAIIPNDTVSYAKDLPADVRQKITDAILQMTKTDAGKAALNSVYQVSDVKQVDDSFYDDYRVYLEAIHFDVNSYK